MLKAVSKYLFKHQIRAPYNPSVSSALNATLYDHRLIKFIGLK